MNILYLHSHDTGRYIQPYGYAVVTPNLQQLADGGVLFRNAHSVAPTCSPSRAGLLTGQCAHASGMIALAHRGGFLTHPERHLGHFLAGHGFEIVHAGMSHVGKPEDCGYTRLSGCDNGRCFEVADWAANFLKTEGREKPFFLDVGFVDTHRLGWKYPGFSREHDRPRDGDGDPKNVMPPSVLPDTPETRRDWLDFQIAAERLDACYGRILDALDASHLADDTLVLATTDHGIAFPHMKCSLTGHGTGVLQILRLPRGQASGVVTDALVSHLDFYPTVCDLLDLPHPDWLEGTSLLPLMEGKVDSIRDKVFAEVTFHAAFEPKRSVRTQRWNYIRNFAAPHTTVMPNTDDGLSKRLWVEHGMKERVVLPEELYDLVFDPQERRNLSGDPSFAQTKGKLRASMDAWMERTGDPLLSEEASVIPLPQEVNTWDELQPSKGTDWDPAQWRLVRR